MLGRKAAVGYYKLIEKLKSVIQCSGGEVHKSSTSDLCVFTTVYTEILLSYLGGEKKTTTTKSHTFEIFGILNLGVETCLPNPVLR